MRFFLGTLMLAAGLLASCASSPPTVLGAPARFEAPPPLPGRGVALVLSGGSARGFAHVGVIRVLEEAGLRPELVVGSSAGAIIGALYASGMTAGQLTTAMSELDRSVFTDVEIRGLGLIPGSMGLFRGERIHRFIDDRVKRHHMEDFPIRFAAVATDLANGKPQILNAGDVGLAVQASSAVPGLFAPVETAGRRLVDGQLSSPTPVDAARRLGARVIIAVDVIYPPEDAAPRTAAGVIMQAFTIAVHRLKDSEIAGADLVLQPDLGHTTGQLSFADRPALEAAGERAARAALPALRTFFASR